MQLIIPEGVKVYEVGGGIRDVLMGIKPHDLDFSVAGCDFTQLYEMIDESGGKILRANEQYMSLKAKLPGHENEVPYDFTVCRWDGAYRDGRHPDEVGLGDIFTDLERRDFTVNAIARNIVTGEIIDPHGGRKDICDRVLRTVGDSKERIEEDYLRLIRAMRFEITKGFQVDVPLHIQMNKWENADKLMETVDENRIVEELGKMFRFSPFLAMRAFSKYPNIRDAIFSSASIFVRFGVHNSNN